MRIEIETTDTELTELSSSFELLAESELKAEFFQDAKWLKSFRVMDDDYEEIFSVNIPRD